MRGWRANRPASLAGLSGGVLGATCCVGPAVGVASGAGAGSFLVAMGRYRPLLFMIGGLVTIAVVALLLTRRRSACRTDAEFRLLRTSWTTAATVAFAVTYGAGRFLVAPLIERL